MRNLIKYCGLVGLIGVVIFVVSLAVEASVTLRSFTATSVENGQSVIIEWETGTEPDAAEFYIYRDQALKNDPVPPLTIDDLDGDSIITINGGNEKATPALGDGSSGASYSATDINVEAGETYRYILVELQFAGDVEIHSDFASVVTVKVADQKMYFPLLMK